MFPPFASGGSTSRWRTGARLVAPAGLGDAERRRWRARRRRFGQTTGAGCSRRRVERSVPGGRGLRRLLCAPSRPAMRRSWRVCAARRAATHHRRPAHRAGDGSCRRRDDPAAARDAAASRARRGGAEADASGEVLSVCIALAAFLLLLGPIGFVGASTAMFIIVARAFAVCDPPARRQPRSRCVTCSIVAPAFCLLVYFAFTRGLDLPLPEARLWSWMR